MGREGRKGRGNGMGETEEDAGRAEGRRGGGRERERERERVKEVMRKERSEGMRRTVEARQRERVWRRLQAKQYCQPSTRNLKTTDPYSRPKLIVEFYGPFMNNQLSGEVSQIKVYLGIVGPTIEGEWL